MTMIDNELVATEICTIQARLEAIERRLDRLEGKREWVHVGSIAGLPYEITATVMPDFEESEEQEHGTG